MSEGTLFTVGHSNRTAGEFLELLAAHGIQTLVDVRRFPGSRRHPQFGQDALAGALGAREIEYLHEADLGGRRASSAGGRVPSPNGAWRVAAFRAYADYALTAPFRAALELVLAHAAQRPTAVMCAEAVPWRCHRRIIADHAVARGWAVQHILAPHRLESHDLHPEARVREDGRVVYPAPDPEQAELWTR
jgi:uncharacterized protein (DUF488 family)